MGEARSSRRVTIGAAVGVGAGVASGCVLVNAGTGVLPAWFVLSGACPLIAAAAMPVHQRAMSVVASSLMAAILVGRAVVSGGPELDPREVGVVLGTAGLGALSIAAAWGIGGMFGRGGPHNQPLQRTGDASG